MGVASSKPQATIDLSVNNTAIRRLLTRLAIKSTARFYKYDGPCVPLSRRLILKRGSDFSLAEIATMAFVAAHTKIPVPRVHCAFTRKNMTYIVMERVRGQTLAEALPALFDDGLDDVLAQLRQMLDELRALPAPGSAIQSCGGGSLFDTRISPQRARFGPLPSTNAFHVWLRQGLAAGTKNPGHVSEEEWAEIMHMIAMQDREWGEPLVFTHGNLNPFNIIVRNRKIEAIIDWEFAGWLPRYWEYTSVWLGSTTRRSILCYRRLIPQLPSAPSYPRLA